MSVLKNESQITETIVRFLRETGLRADTGEIAAETFVPGIEVRAGALVFDETKLKYPGDLLHEAGHLAVMTPAERARTNATIDTGPGEEMAVIAWSYAAALYLGIDPGIVFHPDGYKGDSKMILENFAAGHYFGVPLLQLWGMTVGEKKAAGSNLEPYPKMLKWLRD